MCAFLLAKQFAAIVDGLRNGERGSIFNCNSTHSDDKWVNGVFEIFSDFYLIDFKSILNESENERGCATETMSVSLI